MTHLERKIVDQVKEIINENGTFYQVRHTCEMYDDEITPSPYIEAVTEEQPVIVPAVTAAYVKDKNDNLILTRIPVEEHVKITKGIPTLYDEAGQVLQEAAAPVPVTHRVIIEQAQPAVTDVIKFLNYDRTVFKSTDDIPEDVQEFLDNV